MKHIASLIFAGIVGGLITLGGFQLLAPQNATVQQPLPVQNYAQFTKGYTTHNNINIPPRAANVPFDFIKAAEKAMPAVVHITAKQNQPTANNRKKRSSPFDFFGDDLGDLFFGRQGPRQGTGSGVIIDGYKGYIVTNNHVIDFADDVEVTLYDQRKFKAKVIGKDPSTDLAVLQIEADGLKTLSYANSDNVRVGEWVLAVGNPFNLTSTVTAGIVSAKGRNIDILQDRTAIESFIQTDAAVNPGNSGGALVDDEGNLIGVNTAIASQTGSFAGYSFAIPSNMVKKIVADIIEFGAAQRGFLGVGIQSLDNDLADDLGVNITEGVHILSVQEGAAADKAGILEDDVIVAVNGRKVRNAPELQELVGRNRPGDEVELTINRKGNKRIIAVQLEAPAESEE